MNTVDFYLTFLKIVIKGCYSLPLLFDHDNIHPKAPNIITALIKNELDVGLRSKLR